MNVRTATLAPTAFAGKHLHLLGLRDSGAQATMQLLAAADAVCLNCFGTTRDAYDEHLTGVDVLVASPEIIALPTEHPEMQAAQERGIPIIAWPVLLGGILADHCVYAVAGTSGRQDVAALVGHVLTAVGLDPTCVLASPTDTTPERGRSGKGIIGVAEADEHYDSFLSLAPRVAIITAIAQLDRRFFADMGELQGSFNAFVAGMDLYTDWETPPTLILNWDDPGCRALRARLSSWPGRVVHYGLQAPADYQAVPLSDAADAGFAIRTAHGEVVGELHLPPGARHLASAALAAFVAAHMAGVMPAMILPALDAFWAANGVEDFTTAAPANEHASNNSPMPNPEDAPGDYVIEFMDGSASLGSFEPTLFTAAGSNAERVAIEQTRTALSATMDVPGEPQQTASPTQGPTADADAPATMRRTLHPNVHPTPARQQAAPHRDARMVVLGALTFGLGLGGLFLWLSRRHLPANKARAWVRWLPRRRRQRSLRRRLVAIAREFWPF